jgi:CDGSH iron-sulfur domain-containing protein 3
MLLQRTCAFASSCSSAFRPHGIEQGEKAMAAEPVPAQKAPYGVNVEAGKDYWWCACGRSARQPFCDGSHKSIGLAPQKFTAAETKQVWLCGCKSSSNRPFCDGSHKSM